MQPDKEPSSKAMTWVFAILGGFVIATIDQSPVGFLIGVLLGAVIGQVIHLRKQTRSLQQQLIELHVLHSTQTKGETAASTAPLQRAAQTETVVAATARSSHL